MHGTRRCGALLSSCCRVQASSVMASMDPPSYSVQDGISDEESSDDTGSSASPLETQLVISPIHNDFTFQKGYLGADGEHAAIEGEVQIKSATGDDDWDRVWVPRAYNCSLRLRGADQWPYIRSKSRPVGQLSCLGPNATFGNVQRPPARLRALHRPAFCRSVSP